MPAPRVVLAAAATCLTLGLSVTAHNRFIETSGTIVPISFEEPATLQWSFRPHWPTTHFVSLLVDAQPDGRTVACVDSQGFASGHLDLQWEVRAGDTIVASGRPEDARLRIARHGERVLVLGAFRGSPRQRYTLRVTSSETCAGLDTRMPRIEVGLRPGRPLLAYSISGHVLLLAGAGLLFGFTRRRDKSWPYLQIFEWFTRWRAKNSR